MINPLRSISTIVRRPVRMRLILTLYFFLVAYASVFAQQGLSLNHDQHRDEAGTAENVAEGESVHGAHRRLAAVGDPLDPTQAPQCADALCLVQALLNKRPQIYITANINLQGFGLLPTIDREVTITGVCDVGKCLIDAKGQSGIFVVGLGGILTLKDLDLTGGFCTKGSAVLVSGLGANSNAAVGKLRAINVKFFNNIATVTGGAVSVQAGGSVFVTNSIFYNNKATRGGAVYIGGSEKLPPAPNAGPAETCSSVRSCATFANNEFARNEATLSGGAIFADDASTECAYVGGPQLDITASTFLNNTATSGSGGALLLNTIASGTTAIVRASAFVNNTSPIGDGGNIYVETAPPRAPGSQITAFACSFASTNNVQGTPSVSVGKGSSATFTKCDFSAYLFGNATRCNGACNITCPVKYGSIQPSNESTCSNVVPPGPTCPWRPEDCPPPAAAAAPTGQPSPPLLSSPAPRSPPPTRATNNPPPPASRTPPPPPRTTKPSRAPPPSGDGIVQSVPNPSPSPSPQPSAPYAPPSSSSPASKPRRPPPPGGQGVVQSVPSPSPPSPSPSPSSPNTAPPPPPSRGSVSGDPHFIGKHGERFDFHGKDGRDYCVLSDKDIHINMHVFHGKLRKSTFISKLGVLYKDQKILVQAQSHDEDGWKLFVDNVEVKGVDNTISTISGLTVTKGALSARIYAEGQVDIVATIVKATFGRRGSFKNYINLQVAQLRASPQVHGLLGQTYQETASTYEKLHAAKSKKRSRAAEVILDGVESDYITTDIFTPDCKFASFEGRSTYWPKVKRMLLAPMQRFHTQKLVTGCTGFGVRCDAD